jgi:bis(5'-nucleosidyl)-tetraphosphatase
MGSSSDKSCGIIPLKQTGESWLVFMVRHRAGHWGFPKGHPEVGEREEETAARELQEETGLDIARLFDVSPISEDYWFTREGNRTFKRVVYFLALVQGEVVLQEEEVSDGRWVSFEEAEELLAFSQAKALCGRIQALLPELEG